MKCEHDGPEMAEASQTDCPICLKSKLRRLGYALEFYSKESRYFGLEWTPEIIYDGGKMAREALKEIDA